MARVQTVGFSYEELEREELTPEELADVEMAVEAQQSAHAPGSHFFVGATVRTTTDVVLAGWNVENAIHHALHAEENALGKMTAEHRAAGLKRVVVVGSERGEESPHIATPCGACRQKLMEFVHPGDEPVVLLTGITGKVLRVKLRDLLPLRFEM